MSKKRFEIDDEGDYLTDNKTGDLYDACGGGDGFPFVINEYHKLQEENEQLREKNKKLKLQNGELLYQIGEVGKNNKTCRECECFISEDKYCYMWDMEVEADDVVVACDQRKVKKSEYSNELNVFEHCKKYKTECKNIYWRNNK